MGEHQLDIHTSKINDPIQRLRRVILTMVFASKENPSIEYVNESVLHKIIIAEGAKAYHTKSVDYENKEASVSQLQAV